MFDETITRARELASQQAGLSAREQSHRKERVRHLLDERDAVLVAHYYTDPALQELAEETGGCVADSLEMARFGHDHSASTLVVAGVRFMGETAKILNPEKRVLMPELEATCSLDIGCPIEEFGPFCDEHPDRTVVVYANTSAEVKARADWVVTSGISLEVVRHLHSTGKRILWAPDRHLGAYVQERTGVDMLLWDGDCVVHDEFKGRELARLREQMPGAVVLAHPESPAEVLALADEIGSTTQLIASVKRRAERTFIVATDRRNFHKMTQAAPDKTLIEAPTAGDGATCLCCAHCPWMAMNGLRNLERVLETCDNEILIDEDVRRRAAEPLRRLLEFAQNRAVDISACGTV